MTDLFDTTNIQSGEPSELYIGDLTRWRRTDISEVYDPTLYDLAYSMRKSGAGDVEINITATSDATGFYVDESRVDTELYQYGTYHWQAYVVRKSDSERVSVDRGQMALVVNMDTDESDPRTHAAKMVDMLESALENRAGSDVIYYMIGGRAVSKIPPGELRTLLDQYRQELANETAAYDRKRGKTNQNTIDVRFME